MRVITIGRDMDNDYVVNDQDISRHHTQIILTDEGRFLVVDMGTESGTYVNGVRISGEQELNPSDTVCIGGFDIDWMNLFPAPVQESSAKADRTSGKRKIAARVAQFLNFRKVTKDT